MIGDIWRPLDTIGRLVETNTQTVSSGDIKYSNVKIIEGGRKGQPHIERPRCYKHSQHLHPRLASRRTLTPCTNSWRTSPNVHATFLGRHAKIHSHLVALLHRVTHTQHKKIQKGSNKAAATVTGPYRLVIPRKAAATVTGPYRHRLVIPRNDKP